MAEEERFDSKFVLRTNATLPVDEVALRYKDLWMVEVFFRAAKSFPETRPVVHEYDDTIRGHIFLSSLALLLRHELMSSLAPRGEKPEWADIMPDLAALQKVEVEQDGRRYHLRLPLMSVNADASILSEVAPRWSTVCMAAGHERMKAFLEGHMRAFSWLGGVPEKIVYDNHSTAVRKRYHKRPERPVNFCTFT
ncbi:MAG TPA: hypothetical protein GXX51_02260 [Firmicutes bacterium]|nr:hypothetical protein [Bacillota bacterium]